MKVFKFGGASVHSVERIKNMATILQDFSTEKIVIIISAMGKTTNALEKVTTAFFEQNKETALALFYQIKQQHIDTAKQLLLQDFENCYQQLNNYFTEVEWLLHDKPVRNFDYYYDQIVCIGELLSTTIISYYLNEVNVQNALLDVRDFIKTDNNFRDANIDFDKTNELIQQINFKKNFIITQGFIGCTEDNESTTLGREGSDYTAAVFANLLNAESLTIWKDVEGVMSADPKQFTDATLIQQLSFDEVIEMAYYGAQVIHPKTIKPLQNKNIPLYVKCFLNRNLPGTSITQTADKKLPAIVVIKTNQVLLHLHSKDFSFVGEKPMAVLYEMLAHLKIKPNLIQTGAVSLQIGLDNREDKIEQLALAAATIFDVQVEKGLQLLTIRHYTEEVLNKLTQGKEIILMQKTKDTVQVLSKELVTRNC